MVYHAATAAAGRQAWSRWAAACWASPPWAPTSTRPSSAPTRRWARCRFDGMHYRKDIGQQGAGPPARAARRGLSAADDRAIPARRRVLMGSDSDLPVMAGCARVLEEYGLAYDLRVLSAHRSPEEAARFAREARGARHPGDRRGRRRRRAPGRRGGRAHHAAGHRRAPGQLAPAGLRRAALHGADAARACRWPRWAWARWARPTPATWPRPSWRWRRRAARQARGSAGPGCATTCWPRPTTCPRKLRELLDGK